MGAGALNIKLVVPFPIPAHQTRRADFPHRAFRPASSSGPRSRSATASPGDRAASETFGSVWGLNRLSPMSPSAASSTACRKSGPFARSALPSFNALMALSDSRCRPPSLPMALVYHAPPTLGLPLSPTRSAFPACRDGRKRKGRNIVGDRRARRIGRTAPDSIPGCGSLLPIHSSTDTSVRRKPPSVRL